MGGRHRHKTGGVERGFPCVSIHYKIRVIVIGYQREGLMRGKKRPRGCRKNSRSQKGSLVR